MSLYLTEVQAGIRGSIHGANREIAIALIHPVLDAYPLPELLPGIDDFVLVVLREVGITGSPPFPVTIRSTFS